MQNNFTDKDRIESLEKCINYLEKDKQFLQDKLLNPIKATYRFYLWDKSEEIDITAVNINEAIGIFLKTNDYIRYSDIKEHLEV